MIQEIICLAILYICLVGWANTPKPATAPIAVQPETTTPPPMPKPMIEPMPKPAYVATAPKAIAAPVEVTPQPAQDLSALPIRELYRLASARQLPRYKRLSKAALVEALS